MRGGVQVVAVAMKEHEGERFCRWRRIPTLQIKSVLSSNEEFFKRSVRVSLGQGNLGVAWEIKQASLSGKEAANAYEI